MSRCAVPARAAGGPVASGLTPLWEEAAALKERKERLSMGGLTDRGTDGTLPPALG